MSKAKYIFWKVVTYYILFRGFMILGEAADKENLIMLVEALIYMGIAVGSLWIQTKEKEESDES